MERCFRLVTRIRSALKRIRNAILQFPETEPARVMTAMVVMSFQAGLRSVLAGRPDLAHRRMHTMKSSIFARPRERDVS